MDDESKVRGERGLIRYRILEKHGFGIQKIKEWRECEPSVAEIKTALALGLDELPLYDVRQTCGGAGDAD